MSLLELITVAIIVCLLIPFTPTILLIMVLIVCSPIIAILKVLEIIIDPLVDRQMKREKKKEVILMKKAKEMLKEEWRIESTDELQFDPDTMTIWNAVGTDGKTVPLSFEEVSGIAIGGLTGSGKTMSLIAPLVKMVKTGVVDLTVIDGKGCTKQWEHFDKVGTLIPLKVDKETGSKNFKEIADYMESMVEEGYQRMDKLSELEGWEFNFWNSPITSDMPFKVVVIDECQLIFNTKPKNKEEREAMERIDDAIGEIVKVFRRTGYCVILTTQRPTSATIPTHIRDNCGLTLSFRVSKTESEMATIGDAKVNEKYFAMDIPKDNKGVAVIAEEDGERQMVRYAYLDEKSVEKELNEYAEEQNEN